MERRLAAILALDVVGYSRLMGADEIGTFERLKAIRKALVQPSIAEHKGRIVKLMGDGLLAEFPSVVEAVQCAIDIQQDMERRDAELPQEEQVRLRIGVNLGDLIVEGTDIYGDGVNITARLESLAEPGGICISRKVYDEIKSRLPAPFEDLGRKEVRNIREPVRVFRWSEGAAARATVEPESPGALPLPEKPSIAVLPFDNMSGDPEQEYLVDGITEEITTALSRLRWFLVIARNSAFVYKGKSVDVTEVGRELGVHYVLEGSVRKAGNRVRITVQLVDTTAGAHHWAQTFDRDLDDIFALQDDITRSVTAAIEPKLLAAEGARSQSRSQQDLGAWELVARAMEHYRRLTKGENEAAIELLRSAVQRYPEYGPAHSLLAFVLLVSVHTGWTEDSGERDYPAELARRAVQLDDEDPWAHLALGCLAFTERNTDEAVRECKKALELNPNFATAHGYLGWALALDGQSEEAIRNLEFALRLSPHDPIKPLFHAGISAANYLASRYDEAARSGYNAASERPEFITGWRIYIASLAQAGRSEEAKDAMLTLKKLQPNISVAWIEEHVPYTERAMPHFIEGMRKAGLT